MPRALARTLVAALALHALPAAAQELAPLPPPQVEPPAGEPPVAPPPPGEPSAPARERADDLRFTDANADRVVLGSTAETHPAGTVFFSDYELFLLQLGYAVTDDLQISIAGVPPLVKDQPLFLDLGLKLNVVRGPVFRAALTGAVDIVAGSSISGSPYVDGRLAAIGQFCFNATCRASLSINAGTVVGRDIKDVFPVYGSAGLLVNVSRVVSLLAEPALVGAVGTSDNIKGGALLAFDYGVRLAGRNWGVDLTFIEPLALTNGPFENPFVFGYPFVAFTYRTDGDLRPSAAKAARASTPAAAMSRGL